MSYIYKTKGTCSTQIEVELDGNIVKNVKFTGGCQGNLQAIPRLVEGMTVEEVERRISGIHCGMKTPPVVISLPGHCAKPMMHKNA